MNERVLFEPEGDFELLVVVAGEVDANGGHGHWFLGLRETKLYHESEWDSQYLTSLGLVSMREMWYWYFLVQVSTMP